MRDELRKQPAEYRRNNGGKVGASVLARRKEEIDAAYARGVKDERSRWKDALIAEYEHWFPTALAPRMALNGLLARMGIAR